MRDLRGKLLETYTLGYSPRRADPAFVRGFSFLAAPSNIPSDLCPTGRDAATYSEPSMIRNPVAFYGALAALCLLFVGVAMAQGRFVL
jgi:hypothetical protein